MYGFLKALTALAPLVLILVAFHLELVGWVTIAVFAVLITIEICLYWTWWPHPDHIEQALGIGGGIIIVLCDDKLPRFFV